MGKKDQKKAKKEDFSANPFKTLKGFVVGTPQKCQAPKGTMEERKEKPTPSAESDDATLFARQMKALGVKTLSADERLAIRELRPPMEKRTDSPSAPRTDEELFLQELGRMDVTFQDALPEEEDVTPTASPRRMKQVRRGALSPEARLDLHGLSRTEALERVGHFLQDCVYQGKRTVLIITGRGTGSQDGPVLRPAIESYLGAAGRAWVSEWGRAPKQYGGDGALVVFLKGGVQDSKT